MVEELEQQQQHAIIASTGGVLIGLFIDMKITISAQQREDN
jgi:hypothetical protein